MTQPAEILRSLRYILLPAIVICAQVGARAAILPDTAKLVPPGTAFLAEFSDLSAFQKNYRQTTFFNLCQDPAMKGFIDEARSRVEEQIKKDEKGLLQTILDVKALPKGRVALVIVLDKEKTRNSLAEGANLLIIAQWGDAIEKVREAVNKILAKAAERDTRVQREDYRGLSITTVGQDPSDDVSYTIDDDCLIASTDVDVLKFVVAHLKGAGSATLADEPDYVNAGKPLAPYSRGHLAVFVNIRHIVGTLLATEKGAMARPIVANLGLDNVVSLALKLGPGDLPSTPHAYSYGQAFLRVDGAKKGICKILELKSGPVDAPRFVAADALSLVLVNIDLKNAFDEIYKIAAGFSPQVAALLNMPLVPPSPQGDPGITIRNDVIAHLGSQIVVAQREAENPKGSTADAQAAIRTSDLLAVAVTNRAGLERSVSRLHSQFTQGAQSQTRELLGHTMYLIDVTKFIPAARPAPPSGSSSMAAGNLALGSAPAAAPTVMALTITDTHLLFGPESEIERAIRLIDASGQDSLAQASWFRKAKSQIPSVAGMAGFENTALSGKMLWQMLKTMTEQQKEGDSQDTTISLRMGSGKMFPTPVTNLLDFSLLPDFEAVKRYFGLSVSYGVSRPDGFMTELKYVQPD